MIALIKSSRPKEDGSEPETTRRINQWVLHRQCKPCPKPAKTAKTAPATGTKDPQ
jgi:hypothetical protein